MSYKHGGLNLYQTASSKNINLKLIWSQQKKGTYLTSHTITLQKKTDGSDKQEKRQIQGPRPSCIMIHSWVLGLGS